MSVAASTMAEIPVASSALNTRALASTVAHSGVCLWILVAPFEATRPLVHLPGQSLSSVEAALLAVFCLWGGAVAFSCVATASWQPAARVLRTPLTAPWLAFLAAVMIAALAAPTERANAVHMAGRFGLAFGVFLVASNGITSLARLKTVCVVGCVSAVAVSILAALEFAGFPPVLRFLTIFRPGVAVVGSQVRAAGPFQYPTIASMYLEILFAWALVVLQIAIDERRSALAAAATVALAVSAEAVILTFTRSGIITILVSLAIAGAWRWRSRRFDVGTKAVAGVAVVLAIELLTSRSLDFVRLRLTSESQENWYQASVDAPARVALGTGATTTLGVTLTNTGLTTWDSQGDHPFRLAYHWLLPDADRSIDFEGVRTDFWEKVPPGGSLVVAARVRGPVQPGEYRLMWDVVQEGRLWFSSQQGAESTFTNAVVSGPAVAPMAAPRMLALPKGPSRPGRFKLWNAAERMWKERPLVGVGPDNFRLLYGPYARIANADPRVHTNNMYIEILVGAGLAGALTFAWLGWRIARTLIRAMHSAGTGEMAPAAAGIAAGCAAIAVHGLADSFFSFTATYVIFGITLGLAVVSERLATLYAHRV